MTRNKALAGLALAVVMTGTACSSSGIGGPDPTNTVAAKCANPVRGKRWGVCGKVSTAAIGDRTAQYGVVGAVDSTTPAVTGGSYSIQGASFHAKR